MQTPHDTKTLPKSCLHLLLNGDHVQTTKLVLDAITNGLSIRAIYLNSLQPALYEVRHLWANGTISVAQEHLAAATAQTALAALYSEAPLPAASAQQAVIACLSDNKHQIGPHMLADLMQFAGYNALFVAANSAEEDAKLLACIDKHDASVIGLSASMPRQIASVQRTREAIRSEFASRRPALMVGGLAFNHAGDLWRDVGADLWGYDAGHAIDQLTGT